MRAGAHAYRCVAKNVSGQRVDGEADDSTQPVGGVYMIVVVPTIAEVTRPLPGSTVANVSIGAGPHTTGSSVT